MTESARLQLLMDLEPEERRRKLAEMRDDERKLFEWHWPLWARVEQMPPAGEWRTWLIMAGRGFGKTRAGAEWIRARADFQNGGWIFTEPRSGMRVFNLATGQTSLFVDTWQKAAEVQEPSGGLYVDCQARAAIGALISALRAAGIYPPA